MSIGSGISINELDEQKKRITSLLVFCLNKQLQNPQEDKWIDREIALHQALATVEQTIVLEYRLRRSFEASQKKGVNTLPEIASRYSN